MFTEDKEGMRFKEKTSEAPEKTPDVRFCEGEQCRNQAVLKYLTENARKVYHELNQPLMVIQGYLELIKLGKSGTDVESIKKILEIVFEQLQTMNEIQGRLKDVLCNKEIKNF